MHIPDTYVSSIQERLNLYTELDKIEQEDQVAMFKTQLRDRFGRIPGPVNELFEGLRLRWFCRCWGIERIILKNDKLRAYFIENPQSPFYESAAFKHILAQVTGKGIKTGMALKQSGNKLLLVKDDVRGLKKALEDLKALLETD